MSLFPVFIALCIAAVFFGAATSSGRTSLKRALLGYIQLLFWWPLTVYYFGELVLPEPDRAVTLPAMYEMLVRLGLPLLFTALFSFGVLARGSGLFARAFAIAAGGWTMVNWFYLALAYPFDAPNHNYTIAWSEMKPLAASNGCALAIAALALAWYAINPNADNSSPAAEPLAAPPRPVTPHTE